MNNWTTEKFIGNALDAGLMTADEYHSLDAGDFDDYPAHPDVCLHVAGEAVVGHVLGLPIAYINADYFGFGYIDIDDDYCEDQEGGEVAFGASGDDTATGRYKYQAALIGGVFTSKLFNDGDTSRFYEEDLEDYFMTRGPAYFHEHLTHYFAFAGILDSPPEEQQAVIEQMWDEVGRIIEGNLDLVEGLAAVLFYKDHLDGDTVYEAFRRIEARRTAS